MKLLISLTLLFLGNLFCGELVMVASKHSPIEQLSKQQIRELYLKRKQLIGDKKVVVVNLPASNQNRIAFDRLVIRMDADNLLQHWNKLHYQGVNPPLVQNSFDGVKALVKKVEMAIGYIDSDNLDDELKIIATLK